MPNARRTGLTTLRNLAQHICKGIGAFTPLIHRVYPDATALHLALEALGVACQTFVLEANDVLGEGV